MLYLNRKPGQSIVIGADIEVIVCKIVGKQVQLGVKAPRSVTINRSEVHRSVQETLLQGIEDYASEENHQQR